MTGKGLAHYQPLFCEENAWQMLRDPLVERDAQEVWFVSNAAHRVATWGQHAAPEPGAPVVWDYHVVVLAQTSAGPQVWDPDHDGGCPVPAARWLHASFGPALDPDFPAEFRPRFRCFGAREYRAAFSSDRRHMKTANGAFVAPPPPWPEIQANANEAWCLGDWLRPTSQPGAPPWVELEALLARIEA